MYVTLSLFSGSVALSGASFGEGTGRIWLNNVQCTGSERQLRNCTVSSNGINSCTHMQDAGLRCLSGICFILYNLLNEFPLSFIGCTESDVRLVEGGNLLEGRVELCAANAWSTVCNVGWSITDARVVCRQLGYSIGGTYSIMQSTLVNILSTWE